MKPFGLYATEFMRLEKGDRHWKADLITEFNPLESGLERFVTIDKSFVGKELLVNRPREHPHGDVEQHRRLLRTCAGPQRRRLADAVPPRPHHHRRPVREPRPRLVHLDPEHRRHARLGDRR